MKHNNVFLSLGSNLGNRKANLSKAVQLLAQDPNIKIAQLSSIYQTEPVGGIAQDDFYNCCLKLSTDYNPQELLDKIHQIEQELCRVRDIVWGPRTIDLDILWFDNLQIKTKDLIIPHKEMHKRKFVLVPLFELVKTDDKLNAKVMDLITKCADRTRVQAIITKNL